MMNEEGIRRNVYPTKCPNCGKSLQKRPGILKYSVSGCVKMQVKKNGLTVPYAFTERPAPMLSLCGNCGIRIFPELAIQNGEDLELVSDIVSEKKAEFIDEEGAHISSEEGSEDKTPDDDDGDENAGGDSDSHDTDDLPKSENIKNIQEIQDSGEK